MQLPLSLFLLSLSLSVLRVASQAPDSAQSPSLAVRISTSFPSAEVFGIKVVNKKTNFAILSISNNETVPLTLTAIGGSLWTIPALSDTTSPSQNLLNLTTAKHSLTVPAGEAVRVEYKFKTDLNPQDLRLQLLAVFSKPSASASTSSSSTFTLTAFNESVSVVEPDTSLLDPQVLFLYAILAAGFAATAYFVYSTFVAPLLPQKRRVQRAGKGGRRAGDSDEKIGGAGAEGAAAAVASGSRLGYDETWIPEHHMRRPDAKRVRSGTPKGKARN